ncbi:hypothetical protein TNIN_318681 [Trichonephila inaurata madagascariensis]|uniref:Uncharacterized protein n=1 Tax=Trichonephila inaurata madagascariensis TaxID=2747483 RepID=A0A8X7CA77_9ARAC|nr:hypothetical protein TNIN_318681 [Trichonephila inaurata madagascariensis]
MKLPKLNLRREQQVRQEQERVSRKTESGLNDVKGQLLEKKQQTEELQIQLARRVKAALVKAQNNLENEKRAMSAELQTLSSAPQESERNSKQLVKSKSEVKLKMFKTAEYKKMAQEEVDAAAALEEQKRKIMKDHDALQHKLDELQADHEKLDKSKRKLQSGVED